MEIRKEKEVLVLKLTADDLSNPAKTSRVVEDLLKVDGERRIVADLAEIDAIYSLQIGTLVTVHVMCYENLAIMKLANASEKVKGLLRMVGLDTLMEMHHGTEVAMRSFGPPVPDGQPRPGSVSDPRLKRG